MPRPRKDGGGNSRYLWCDHCKEMVCKTTYYEHLRKYGQRDCQASCSGQVDVKKDSHVENHDTVESGNGDVTEDSTPPALESEELEDGNESVYWDVDEGLQPNAEAGSVGSSEEDIRGGEEDIGDSEEDIGDSEEDIGDSEEDIGDSEEDIGDGEEDTRDSEEDIGLEEMEEEVVEEERRDMNDSDEDVQLSWLAYLILCLTVWKSYFTISDNAYIVLLNLLRSFLFAVGSICRLDLLKKLAQKIPSTMYMVRKMLSLNKDDFIRYVACPVCNKLYTIEEATIIVRDGRGVRKKSARCSHVEFKRHAQKRRRQGCGTLLLKTVIGKNGASYLYPKRTFCYRNITKSLQDIAQRPGFNEACEKWRERNVSDNVYGDTYDGKIWKDFQSYEGKPFLSEECNLALMLNVDWFQPYDKVKDSVGVMYLVIMNLPREERFKEENIIVVGIIPGPREPKGHINPYLKPLVNDLNDLWKGVYLSDSSALGKQLYRAALLCLSSDIPASRKTGGFLGHMAKMGCSKCLKEFPRTTDNKADYSGFQCDQWLPRSKENHVLYARKAKRATSKAEQARIEAIYGARYSVLHELPYFDPVRMHVIDPMHNILEGTAKRVMQVWKETGILNSQSFQILQSRVNSLKVPSDLDPGIPAKIESAFEGFTASQWKIWVCTYSLYALKGLLNDTDYNIWKCFVSAARILCSRVITANQLDDADRCLRIFCNAFERKYGREWCTMNMHLHLHLKSCIIDYGPVHGFWCFSFERANGTLGDYHTNNRHAELIMMRKWLLDWQMSQKSKCVPEQLEEHFPSVAQVFERKPSQQSYLLHMDQLNRLKMLSDSDDVKHDFTYDSTLETLLPPLKRGSISHEESQALLLMFRTLYENDCVHRVSNHCTQFNRYTLGGELLSSEDYRADANSCICAKWFRNDEETGEPVIDLRAEARPALISRMLKVIVFLKKDGKKVKAEHTVAEVKWFKQHSDRYYYSQNDLCSVWEINFEPFSYATYLPLKRITVRCAYTKTKVRFSRAREETVSIVVPVSSIRCI